MARINLLPWRDQLRKDRERRFYAGAALAVVAMLGGVAYAHMFVASQIDAQDGRSQYLTQQIALVDKEIEAIKTLEVEKQRLLNRMSVIQQLQISRPAIVHVLESLVETLPEGAQLVKIQNVGPTINIEGIAESNARVSAFMRNLDKSRWLANPELIVIDSSKREFPNASWFSLKVQRTDSEKPQGTAP